MSACDIHSGEPLLVDTKTTKTPLLQVLRAAMAVPVLYNRGIDVDGHSCIDGGTVLPFPLLHVFERDCTDVLLLLTRPAGFVEVPPTKAMCRIFNIASGGRKKQLCHAFAMRHQISRCVRDMALGRIGLPPNLNVAAICPEEDATVESMTTHLKKLHRAAVSYGRKTYKVFGQDPANFAFPSVI